MNADYWPFVIRTLAEDPHVGMGGRPIYYIKIFTSCIGSERERSNCVDILELWTRTIGPRVKRWSRKRLACYHLLIMNIIKSPKSGPAKARPAGPAPTPMHVIETNTLSLLGSVTATEATYCSTNDIL